MFERIVNYAETVQSSKRNRYVATLRVFVRDFSLSTQFNRLLVSIFGRIGAHQDEICVDNVARITFYSDLLNQSSKVPLCVLWNVAHMLTQANTSILAVQIRVHLRLFTANGSDTDNAMAFRTP